MTQRLEHKLNGLLEQLKSHHVLKMTIIVSMMGGLFIAACAKGDMSSTEVALDDQSVKVAENVAVAANKDYGPPIEFRGTISGDVLEMTPKVDGEVFTDQVKQFIATGENPYGGNSEAIKKGYKLFSTACSGCHGHLGEGKLGPALADDYWTYPKNETDKGLFETIYGGAQGMMGPQQGLLQVDEILHIIAWIRHQGKENANGAQTAH